MPEENAVLLLDRFRSNAGADTMISLLRSREAAVSLALMTAQLGGGEIVEAQTLSAAFGADLHAIGRSSVAPEDDVDSEESPLCVTAAEVPGGFRTSSLEWLVGRND